MYNGHASPTARIKCAGLFLFKNLSKMQNPELIEQLSLLGACDGYAF